VFALDCTDARMGRILQILGLGDSRDEFIPVDASAANSSRPASPSSATIRSQSCAPTHSPTIAGAVGDAVGAAVAAACVAGTGVAEGPTTDAPEHAITISAIATGPTRNDPRRRPGAWLIRGCYAAVVTIRSGQSPR
jgi:hypothetical protein